MILLDIHANLIVDLRAERHPVGTDLGPVQNPWEVTRAPRYCNHRPALVCHRSRVCSRSGCSCRTRTDRSSSWSSATAAPAAASSSGSRTGLRRSTRSFPFEFAIMVGDNLYGGEGPTDFRRKFEEPYKPLLDAGVKFYAALGNHDDPTQRFYKNFNMNGERFYTFKAPKTGLDAARAAHASSRSTATTCRRSRCLAREGAEGERLRLEDPLLPSSALLVRREARLRRGAARAARAAVREVRRGRGLRRPRALLRTAQAAEGHHLLRQRQRREAAQGATSASPA